MGGVFGVNTEVNSKFKWKYG